MTDYTDLVRRLLARDRTAHGALMAEAADAIEQLQAELDRIDRENVLLPIEGDDAIGREVATIGPVMTPPTARRLHDVERIAARLEMNRYRIASHLCGIHPELPPGSENELWMWANIAREIADELGLR